MRTKVRFEKNEEITPEFMTEVMKICLQVIKQQKYKDEVTGEEYPIHCNEVNLYFTTRDPDGRVVPLLKDDTGSDSSLLAQRTRIHIVRPPMKEVYVDDTNHLYIYQE